jgi:hypothetical protein
VDLVEHGPLEPQRVALEPLAGLGHLSVFYIHHRLRPELTGRRRQKGGVQVGFQGEETVKACLPRFPPF